MPETITLKGAPEMTLSWAARTTIRSSVRLGPIRSGGGSGFDYLYGGAGAGVFCFGKGDSFDTVWDFSAAEGDKIRLDPAFGIVTLADLQSHLSGFAFEGANYTVISFPNSVDQLTIKGIAPSAFTFGLLDL